MQIGCVEEGEYICMAYEKNRWVSRRHEASAEEVRWNSCLCLYCPELWTLLG